MNPVFSLLRSHLEIPEKSEAFRVMFDLGFEPDYSNPNICYGGKGGGGTNTVTSNSAPPPEIMAAYQQALSGATAASSAPLQQYSGQTVAGLNSDETSAFGSINNAQGAAQPFINNASNLLQQSTTPLWNGVQQFSPDAINQYSSPYTQQVLQSAMASQNNQDAQQQQALKGNAISSGAWGGDRAGVASAILSGQQDIANNSTNANILNTGYNNALGEFNTEQQAQLGANSTNAALAQQGAFGMANLGSEALGTQLTGANAQLASGQLQQQQTQSELNVPYQQFLQQQAYPFQTAQYYANIAEGIGGNSGGTGNSNSTAPGASTASQIGGGLLGGLGLYGAAGGFSGAAGFGLGPLLFAKRGGRIERKGFAAGGDIPDLSVSYIPVASATASHGMGPPQPPEVSAPKATDPMGGNQEALLSAFLKSLGTEDKTTPLSGSDVNGFGQVFGNGAGVDSDTGNAFATQNDLSSKFLSPGSTGSLGLNWKRSGPVGYDNGGGIPMPPDPDQSARQLEVQNDIDATTAPVPDAALQPPPGGFGTQMVASAEPPPSAMGTAPVAEEAAPAHREVNPWLALAAAGFGAAAGTSPQAGVNFGRGALEGLSNYAVQQKEADSVNTTADRLLQEARQHKEQIAIEQQNADTTRQSSQQMGEYQKAQIANMRAERQKPIPDGMGGFLIPNAEDPTHPQRIDGPFGSVNGSDGTSITNAYTPPKGSDGKALSGDTYLATLPGPVAALTKKFGDNVMEVTPYMMTKGDPLIKAAISAAQIYNPGWNQASYKNVNRFDFDPNGGVKAKSLDTVAPHLLMLEDLTKAMKTGDVQLINQAQNKIATEFGIAPEAANLQAAQQLVGNEIINSTIAQGRSGGALGDREEIAKNLNAAASPEILLSNIDNVYKPAIRAQLNSTRQYYKAATGLDDFDKKYLLPETRSLLGPMGGGATSSAPVQPPVANAKQAPDGNWYVSDPNRPGKYLQVQ